MNPPVEQPYRVLMQNQWDYEILLRYSEFADDPS